MIKNSFCHIPGIGPVYEQRLWSLGFDTWEAVRNRFSNVLAGRRFASLDDHLDRSAEELSRGNASYFAKGLPSEEQWRLYGDFRHAVAYIDIETTRSALGGNVITSIALYDGARVRCYVRGRNLERFEDDIGEYKLLVTYNGKCFDAPIIEQTFRMRLHAAHIDLRFLLASLGYPGGLKSCEKQFGIDRGELDGVNGYCAVLLWEEYARTGNERALETLIAYNVQDVIHLETLMVGAYNQKLKRTPFLDIHEQAASPSPHVPWHPDADVLRRLRSRIAV